MGSFIKTTLAAALGLLIAIGLLMMFGAVLLAGLVSATSREQSGTAANSVLVIDQASFTELTGNAQQSYTDGSLFEKPDPGLADALRAIEAAADDDDIKGIFLDVSALSTGSATAMALHRGLLAFRESGKFVVAHGKYFGQNQYLVASAADQVYLNPAGGLDLRGYGVVAPYFAEGLDRLGVDVNVFYAGDFKSAGEPFFRSTMSDSNRLQTREYLADLWAIYLDQVAMARGLERAELERITEQFLARNDSSALAYGLVDELWYKDQLINELKVRVGIDEEDDLITQSLKSYAATLSTPRGNVDPFVAVVYAEGMIVDGSPGRGLIGDGDYARLVRKLRRDEDCKAIVLRVNSGGGSAMASENIWRELKLAGEEGIPIITSMGDVAASGGYYIAMPSDTIYAEPNTITGSIGVVGIVPNFGRMLEDQAGIHFDTVRTGEYAASFSAVVPWSEQEKQFVQEGIEEVYELFTSRVAEGRGLPLSTVKRYAKGRVYSGQDALDLGLVDRLGSLDDAIANAARLTEYELEELRIASYPRLRDPQEELIEELLGNGSDKRSVSLRDQTMSAVLGQHYEPLRPWLNLLDQSGPQAVMLERVVE